MGCSITYLSEHTLPHWIWSMFDLLYWNWIAISSPCSTLNQVRCKWCSLFIAKFEWAIEKYPSKKSHICSIILRQSNAIWYHIHHSVDYFELLDELWSVGGWRFEEIDCIIIDILCYVTCHSLWENVFLFCYQGQQRYKIWVVTFISMMYYNTAIDFCHVNGM